MAKAVNDFQGQTTEVITNGVQNAIKWPRFQNTTGGQGHALSLRQPMSGHTLEMR